jgi:circadian clock protein KaiB
LKLDKPLFPQLFKGIALFTPGGDLIYGIDPTKQGHWHLHLCAGLQELLRLPEPPHFLVPGYTATIDRWIDARTHQLRTSAEIYQPVQHHQALLNVVFGTGSLVWQVAPWQEESCDPIVLETYRHQFPQLWEDHDLIVRFERSDRLSYPYPYSFDATAPRFANKEYLANMERYPPGSPKGREQEENPVKQDAIASHFTAAPSDAVQTNVEAAVPEQQKDNNPEEIGIHSHPQRAESYVLRLFVSGHSAATEHTLKSLHQLLESSLSYPYTLKVIDVFKHPDQAEANQISATPTLLRVWPQPVRRLVGDLTNVDRVLRILAAPED